MAGISANIMSLGGIAIAVGALVDAAIVVVEQTHKKLEAWERGGAKGELPGHRHQRHQGSRRPELLCPTGDRRLVPSRPDARGSGRSAIQAAGLHEDAGHDRSGPARHHA